MEAIKQDWRTSTLTSRERAFCEYAEKLTLTPAEMTRSDLDPLRDLGLTDTGILDLCEVVSYFNYINRIADGLGVDLEPSMGPPR